MQPSDFLLERSDFMSIYKCSLVLSNKEEWLKYILKTIDLSHTKCSDEILRDICNFDFKFDTDIISQ